MEYRMRPVNNGWVVYIDPDTHAALPFGEFVFDSIREMAEWLAQRHGEAGPRKLIEDWH